MWRRNRQDMQRARWFPDSQLNFAETCCAVRDESPAIISRIEGGPSRTLSWHAAGRSGRPPGPVAAQPGHGPG